MWGHWKKQKSLLLWKCNPPTFPSLAQQDTSSLVTSLTLNLLFPNSNIKLNLTRIADLNSSVFLSSLHPDHMPNPRFLMEVQSWCKIFEKSLPKYCHALLPSILVHSNLLGPRHIGTYLKCFISVGNFQELLFFKFNLREWGQSWGRGVLVVFFYIYIFFFFSFLS